MAPGQIGGKEDNGERIDLDGWALLFHPDFLHGTSLEKEMRSFSFFDYNVNEALHTSSEEFEILASFMRRIKQELEGNRDGMQDAIIVDYISLLLNYCKRFYERQFLTRKIANADTLQRFHAVLEAYYTQENPFQSGLPTVAYCADQLCMSAGYLGDLVRRHTGDTAINYIHRFILQKAKSLLSAGKTITEVAYDLGFAYPQHLSRLFKKKEGLSPSEYVNGIR